MGEVTGGGGKNGGSDRRGRGGGSCLNIIGVPSQAKVGGVPGLPAFNHNMYISTEYIYSPGNTIYSLPFFFFPEICSFRNSGYILLLDV